MYRKKVVNIKGMNNYQGHKECAAEAT